jgi:hypothetical protein
VRLTFRIFWLTTFFFSISLPVQAATEPITENLDIGCLVKNNAAPSLGCLAIIVVNIIDLAFFFLGAVTVLYFLYGAILFLFSRGENKAVGKAKSTITFAVIGFIVVASSFVIVRIILQLLGISDSLPFDFTLYQSPPK